MSKRRIVFIAGFIFIILTCVWSKIYFMDRPVIDDVENCRIVKFAYRSSDVKNEIIELTEQTEFNENEVLDCLSRYRERRTFKTCRGGSLEKCQFVIYVDIGGRLKIITVCDDSFSCFTYGSIKWQIINAEKLKEDMQKVIDEQKL